MFKSKEELIKEYEQTGYDITHLSKQENELFNVGYKDGINDAFKSIGERKEFYKKYRRNEMRLREEHPKFFSKYKPMITKGHFIKNVRFEDWLFDECFYGVE